MKRAPRIKHLRFGAAHAAAPFLLSTNNFLLSAYLGPVAGIRSVRLILVVASMLALGCRSLVVVVVVDVSVVVVQPTSAITQTPRTTGISFFMARFYRIDVGRSILFFRGAHPSSVLVIAFWDNEFSVRF
ncbi:MAG: hypothetical protein ABR611_00015 [Chthoniobacterales bacterium]